MLAMTAWHDDRLVGAIFRSSRESWLRAERDNPIGS